MSLDYVSEKLTVAVSSLATGAGSIQQRLEYAAIGCHTLAHEGHRSDFPSVELADRWWAWWDQISSKAAAGGEGTIRATTSSLSDDEAQRLAEELFSIFTKVEQAYVLAHAESIRGEFEGEA